MSSRFRVDDLVWATMRGHPPWPAKVIAVPISHAASMGQPKYKVVLFGTRETALISESDLCDYMPNRGSYEYPRKIPDFNKAVQEIRRMAHLADDDRFREKPRTPSPIAHALANIHNSYEDYGLGELDGQQPSTSHGRRTRRISGLTLSVVDELIASNRKRTSSNASRRSRASSICSNARRTLQNAARLKAQLHRIRNPDSVSSVSGGSCRSRRSQSRRFEMAIDEDPLFNAASDPFQILDQDLNIDLLDDKKNIALLDNQNPAICDSFLLDKEGNNGRLRNSSISSQIFGSRQRLLSGMSDVLGIGSGDDLLDMAAGPGSDHDAEMQLFRAFDAINGEDERAATPEEALPMPVINAVKCSACGCECRLVDLKWRCTSAYCQKWNGAYMPDGGAKPSSTKTSFQFKLDDQGSVSGASTHGMSSCEQAVIAAAAGSDPLYRGALSNARFRAISTSSSHGPGSYFQQPAKPRLPPRPLEKKEDPRAATVPKPIIIEPSTSTPKSDANGATEGSKNASKSSEPAPKKRKTVQIDPMVDLNARKSWALPIEEPVTDALLEKDVPIPTIRIVPATSRPTEGQRKQQEAKQAQQAQKKKNAQPVVNIRRPYGSGRPKSYKVEKTPPVGENGQRHCAFCNGQVRPQMCGGNKHRWRCVDKKCRKWYGWVRSNEEIPKDLGKKGRWKDLQLKIRRKRANSTGTDDGSIYNKPDDNALPKRPATTFRPANGTKKTVGTKKRQEDDDDVEPIDRHPLTEREKAYLPSLMERRARWWLTDKKRPEMSPERELGNSFLDMAATFKTISNSMRTAASTKADQPGTIAGSLDLLMDSLMGSLGPLMAMAAKIPGVEVPEELPQKFWKASLVHTPIL
ncbi:hypothetical protein QR680_007832 [Steinernema hermaphroditum]|uniref:PWWP domain-containing protein n=1 Tax=Steinernema hermaphroditum TaxID=289476 RepID=A0AA39IGK5_9BILA|nr:hypothetical protein QR680_007832 [Steinernema hermaphroditum]